MKFNTMVKDDSGLTVTYVKMANHGNHGNTTIFLACKYDWIQLLEDKIHWRLGVPYDEK